jgi:hypothetical protein
MMLSPDESIFLPLPEGKVLEIMRAGDIEEEHRADLKWFIRDCLNVKDEIRSYLDESLTIDKKIETLSKAYEQCDALSRSFDDAFVSGEVIAHFNKYSEPEYFKKVVDTAMFHHKFQTLNALSSRIEYHKNRPQTPWEELRIYNKTHPEYLYIDQEILVFWTMVLKRPLVMNKMLLAFASAFYGAVGVPGCSERNVRLRLSNMARRLNAPLKKRGRPSSKNGNADRS